MEIRLRNKFYQTLHPFKEPFNENQAKSHLIQAMPSSGEPFLKIKAISYGKHICKRYISAGIGLNQTPDQSKLTTSTAPCQQINHKSKAKIKAKIVAWNEANILFFKTQHFKGKMTQKYKNKHRKKSQFKF